MGHTEADMKEIHLIGDYYCTVDSMNVNLAKRVVTKTGKTAGEERLKVIGYYPNFEKVLRRLAEELQKDRLEEAKELKDAVRIVKETNDEVKALINEVTGWE